MKKSIHEMTLDEIRCGVKKAHRMEIVSNVIECSMYTSAILAIVAILVAVLVITEKALV